MALTRRRTLLIVAVAALPVLLIGLTIFTRDAYPAPTVPALWLTFAGALLAALASAWLLRGQRKPLENPLRYAANILLAGAMAGGVAVSLTLDTLVRLTATQLRTGWVSYAVTPGWKGCLFGVEFEDPVLRMRIEVCGPRWKLPATPGGGVLHIVEESGPYGVVFQRVTTESEPPR